MKYKYKAASVQDTRRSLHLDSGTVIVLTCMAQSNQGFSILTLAIENSQLGGMVSCARDA